MSSFLLISKFCKSTVVLIFNCRGNMRKKETIKISLGALISIKFSTKQENINPF